jgi:hypothetical protein
MGPQIPSWGPFFFSADFGTAGVPAGSFAVSASPKYCKVHTRFGFGYSGGSLCSDPRAVSLIREATMLFG